MKRSIAFLLSLALLCSSLAGCSSKTDEPAPADPAPSQTETPAAPAETPTETPAASEETPDAVQTLNTLWNAEPSVLDIARFLGVNDRSVFYNTLEPLVRIQNGVPVGAGAESWEVSEDGKTYTFHLRDNSWSDGKAVTSEDYATALRRQADAKNAFAFASDYYAIENFEAVSHGEMDASALGIATPDDKTLVLSLTAPTPALLSSTDFFPDRADLAEQYGDTYGTEANTLLSCGPYVLASWTHSSELKFEKNPNYWNADEAKLQSITCSIIPDSNAQLASFENGSLDYLNVSDLDYVGKFQGRDDMSEMMIPAARTMMVIFNCKDSILQNQKIRQAFSLAIDRDLLAEVITNGTATPIYGMIPKECSVGSLNFRENVEEPLLALKAANSDPKALLIEGMKEAGLGEDPSQLTLTLSWGATTATARTYAELYQQMWQEALGCNIELEFNDSSTHMSNINSGKFQLATSSWGANVEPQFQLSRWANKKGGQSQWVNEEYINLVATANQTVDDNERLELYAQAEKLICEEAAMAPIYVTAQRRFYYSYVKGLDAQPFDTTGFMGLYTAGRK